MANKNAAQQRKTPAGWKPPGSSENFREIRHHIDAICGPVAGDAFDQFGFYTGAAPKLEGHSLAISNLATVLGSQYFQLAMRRYESDWNQWVPIWISFSQSWPSVLTRVRDGRSTEWLHPSERYTDGNRLIHPQRDDSLTLAPIVSILPLRHAGGGSNEPEEMAAAERFEQLRATLLCAFFDLRHRSQLTVQDYLHDWKGKEFGRVPTSAGPACLAARWLSEPGQSALVASLPLTQDLSQYVEELGKWGPGVDFSGSPLAARHVRAVYSVLRHWADKGTVPVAKQRERRGKNKNTSVKTTQTKVIDGSLVRQPAIDGVPTQAAVDLGQPHGRPEVRAEGVVYEADLLDDTDDGPASELPLVSSSLIKLELSGGRFQRIHKEMADVVFPFDIDYLQPRQAADLLEHAWETVARQIADDTPKRRRKALGALLAAQVIGLGQPENLAWSIRIALVHDESGAPGGGSCSLEEALRSPIDGPVVLLRNDPTLAFTDPYPATPVIGILLPAVTPQRKNTGKILHNVNHVQNLLVRAVGLGNLLRQWFIHQRGTSHTGAPRFAQSQGQAADAVVRSGVSHSSSGSSTTGATPLGIPIFLDHLDSESATKDVEHATACVLAFLRTAPRPHGWSRWTVERLKHLLPRTVEALTGDRALSWQVSACQTASTEARIYYTQFSLAVVDQTWTLAAHSAGLTRVAGTPTQPAWPAKEWMEQYVVGTRFVAPLDEVQRLIRTLQKRLSVPVAKHDRLKLCEHHNDLFLYTVIVQSLGTALRPARSPVALLKALEQHDCIMDMAGIPLTDADAVYAGVSDKDTHFSQRARLVRMPVLVVRTLRLLRAHQWRLIAALECEKEWQAKPDEQRAMFRMDTQGRPVELDVAWITRRLAGLGFPWPANFARAFVRTQLIARGIPAADLDALLGHRDVSAGSIALHSSFAFEASFARLEPALNRLLIDVGAREIDSPLIRWTEAQCVETAPLIAPIEAVRPRDQQKAALAKDKFYATVPLSPFWDAINRNAPFDDQRELPRLLRLLMRLQRQGNAYAQLLLDPDPVQHGLQRYRAWALNSLDTAESPVGPVPQIEKAQREALERLRKLASGGTRIRFMLAISWFRLLSRAWSSLARGGVMLPDPQQVPLDRAPTSPFAPSQQLAMTFADAWGMGVERWAEDAFKRTRKGQGFASAPNPFAPQGWCAAVLINAAVRGMQLDVTKLSMLLARFTAGPRDLPMMANGYAYIDFWLPASGGLDRQLQRWWFDPLTQFIWLHAPPCSDMLTLRDISPWLKRIATFGMENSAAQRLQPESFSDVVRCAESWWHARTSRSVIVTARRKVDGSSVLSNRFATMLGAERLGAPARYGSQRPAPDIEESEHEKLAQVNFDDVQAMRKAEAGARLPADPQEHDEDEVELSSSARGLNPEEAERINQLHAAYPWVNAIATMLHEAGAAGAAPDPAEMMKQLAPGERPASVILVLFASWLIRPDGGDYSGPMSAITFRAAATDLLMNIDVLEQHRVPDADFIADLILDDDEQSAAMDSTEHTRQESLHRLADYLGCGAEVRRQVQAGLDDESDDDEDEQQGPARQHKRRADARIFSFEEYMTMVEALRTQKHQTMTAADREVAALLLILCFRAGLRPKEAYQLRLRDFLDDALYVLRYKDNGLKTHNARRRVPVHQFLSEQEMDRLRAHVAQRLRDGAAPDDALLSSRLNTRWSRIRMSSFVAGVMRRIGKDPALRLYNARHSFASWLGLAIAAMDYPEILDLFSGQPQTKAFLERGLELAVHIFGSREAALGKTAYAQARLVGHVGPGMTHKHYIHTDHFLQAAIVQREARNMPVPRWLKLLDISRAALFGQLKGRHDMQRTVDYVRSQLGWTSGAVGLVREALPSAWHLGAPPMTNVSLVIATDAASTPGLMATAAKAQSLLGASKPATHRSAPATYATWLGIGTLQRLTQPVARDERDVHTTARMYGMEVERVKAAIDELRDVLPQVAQPGLNATAQARAGRVEHSLSADDRLLMAMAERWMMARASTDARALQSDLKLLIQAYDRRDKDFHVRRVEDLRRLVTVMEGVGVASQKMRLITRGEPEQGGFREMDISLPDWVSEADLGAFVKCEVKRIKARNEKKEDSYRK